MSASKHWCFTLNNHTEDDINNLQRPNDLISYIVFQHERGDSGTNHLQGYIQLSSRKRLNQVKALLHNRAHIERMRGTPTQARTYCMKEEGRIAGPWEIGEFITPGRRTDLIDFRDAAKEKPMSRGECIELYPGKNFFFFFSKLSLEILAKYPQFVKNVIDHYAEQRITTTELIARPGWQQELLTHLSAPPDPRSVIWYFDAVGNSGKSYFAAHYRSADGERGFRFSGGKYADIYHAYNRERAIFLDLTRTSQEKVPYEVLESFKNGGFLATKYQSRYVTFEIPHVIVFANYRPDESALSADRWDIRVI